MIDKLTFIFKKWLYQNAVLCMSTKSLAHNGIPQ